MRAAAGLHHNLARRHFGEKCEELPPRKHLRNRLLPSRHGVGNSSPNWSWHLDEVFVRINGETHYLWRAVDHEGEVLKIFATKGRDRGAALKFLKRTMKRDGRPASIVTDRLQSYRAAMNVIGNAAARTSGRWLNNRAENSHQPFRRSDGAVQRYQDPAEIRLRSRLDPQPLQPPTPSQPSRHFQTRPSRRRGRVATTRSLRARPRPSQSDNALVGSPLDYHAGIHPKCSAAVRA